MPAAPADDTTSSEHRPVFIHINKNAGTSINNAAGHAVTLAGHCLADRWIAQHGRDAPMFAVIRNPFDRTLSEYHYRRARFESGEDNPHLSNLHLGFPDWVRATFVDGQFRTRAYFETSGVSFNDWNMADDSLIWFLPQIRWISTADGERLVGELLRYEHLDDDWVRFCARHGIDAPLVHRNRSQRDRDFRPSYTDEAMAIVADHYRADVDAFGYDEGSAAR